MVEMQSKLLIQRHYVAQLLEQLTIDHQNSQLERKEIAAQHPGSEVEFTPLEELELLTANVRGYASQIKATGSVKNFEQAIAHLKTLSLLNSAAFAQFYVESRSRFPQTYAYIQTLDYLRLLILQYLQTQQSDRPVSA